MPLDPPPPPRSARGSCVLCDLAGTCSCLSGRAGHPAGAKRCLLVALICISPMNIFSSFIVRFHIFFEEMWILCPILIGLFALLLLNCRKCQGFFCFVLFLRGQVPAGREAGWMGLCWQQAQACAGAHTRLHARTGTTSVRERRRARPGPRAAVAHTDAHESPASCVARDVWA